MLKVILGSLLLLGSLLASDSNCWSDQRGDVCQGSCGGGCGPCAGNNNGSRRSGPSALDLAEAAADQIDGQGRAAMKNGDYEQALAYFQEAYDRSQLERNAKYFRDDIAWARGAIANRSGMAAANRRDYAAALAFFQQCVALVPDAEGYQKQVAWAKGSILDEEAYAANARGDYKTALKLYLEALDTLPDPSPEYRKMVKEFQKSAAHQDKITRTLSHIADSANDYRPAPSTPGLEFGAAAAGTPAADSTVLDFPPPESAPSRVAGSGTFGTTSNPAHPGLVSPASTPGTVQTNLEHLSSDAKSGEDAKKARTPEEAKSLAGCGFDGVPCREPDHIEVVKIVGQTPAAVELSSHIPESLRQDDEIKKALAWYDKLEKGRAGNARELAELQSRITSGTGDTVVLKARKAEVEFESQKQLADQASAKKQLGKRVLDLKMSWIETPQPGEAAPESAPQEPAK